MTNKYKTKFITLTRSKESNANRNASQKNDNDCFSFRNKRRMVLSGEQMLIDKLYNLVRFQRNTYRKKEILSLLHLSCECKIWELSGERENGEKPTPINHQSKRLQRRPILRKGQRVQRKQRRPRIFRFRKAEDNMSDDTNTESE